MADARIVAARRPTWCVEWSHDVRPADGACARRARPGGGCCSSSSASPSASPPSWRCGRSSRACATCSASEARTLIAADVLISTNREWTPEARGRSIDRRLAEAGADRAHRDGRNADDGAAGRRGAADGAHGRTAGRRSRRSRSTARWTLEGGQPYSHALLEGPRRARPAGAADALGLQVGRPTGHRAGGRSRSAASSRNEPGRRVGDFSLGPRVLDRLRRPARRPACWRSAAAPAACCSCRLPETRIEPLVDGAARRLQGRVRQRPLVSLDRRRDRRDFDRAENYLSLVGLVIVILGGIAVSSVTRVFVLQKIRSIAVLKCLGATQPADHRASTCCRCWRSGSPAACSASASRAPPMAAIPYGARAGDRPSLLADVHYGVTWSAAAQGLGIGVLVSLLFSVVPLLQVRLVKPSLLLRDEATHAAARLGRAWPRSCSVSAGAGRAHGLAGGVAAGRPDRLRRVLRCWPSSCMLAGRAAGRGRRAAGATRGRSRCAMRCCTCRGRAIRRA